MKESEKTRLRWKRARNRGRKGTICPQQSSKPIKKKFPRRGPKETVEASAEITFGYWNVNGIDFQGRV